MSKLYAVVDIGSLKIKTEVASVNKDGTLNRAYASNTLTCFGEGLNQGESKPREERLKQTITELQRIKQELEKMHVEKFRVVSTHAMRKAVNRDEIIERIKKESGLNVELITETEEAQLFFQAVLQTFNREDQEYAVIDVGGGSVQILVGTKNHLEKAHSMPTGTLPLHEKFTRNPNSANSFTTPEDIEKMRGEIIKQLLPLEPTEHAPLVYGSSMIIDVMKTIKIPLDPHTDSAAHPYKTYANHLGYFMRKVLPMTYEERDRYYKDLPHHYGWGIDKAFLNVLTVADYFKSPYIIPSNTNIAQGIILSMAHANK